MWTRKAAEARAKRVRGLLDQLHSRTISVNVVVRDAKLNKVNRQLSDAAFRAVGGPVTKG
ncbi:hypothetical protein ACQP2F_14305 [Actinoplanes sp. CA-030573]|uniref:hypothetical protein n=1 Tax=Actinoplanes sp. CA-030573 TaxID=3239898 RepID=UPI003D8AC032